MEAAMFGCNVRKKLNVLYYSGKCNRNIPHFDIFLSDKPGVGCIEMARRSTSEKI
jgi:hypothetical protein